MVDAIDLRWQTSANRLWRDDLPCNSARRDHQRARQVHLPGPAPAGEIPVDRGDRDLVRGERDPRTRLDARAARRIHQLGARLREDLEVALLLGVAADVLRAELDVE